jgi:serine/threonine protein kinase
MYALKEVRFVVYFNHSSLIVFLIKIDNRSLETNIDRSLGKMINEVNIIREELRHPNIVSYYQIFAESKKNFKLFYFFFRNFLFR